jgi:hypothetical protein
MRRDEADELQLAATHIALEEVSETLEAFDGAVIAGGTVPFLLVPQDEEPHEGTVDVDVVIDADHLRSDSELTLHDILERRNFVQDTERPYRYTKAVHVEGETRHVLIELLGGGTPPPNGLRRVPREDVYVSVIDGVEIALDNPVTTTVAGATPVRVTSIAGFFAMKASALERREEAKKSKDAYDLVYCLRNYPGGVDAIAADFLDRLPNPILEATIARLTNLFAAQDAPGPTAYSRRAQSDEEERRMRREAYEFMSDLLDRLP